MIEVKNLNKYFNRNKSNQIHVINDTSIKLPKAGLVCLLGASGSGKTTLLNVLGGLDKVDSGEIIFQDYSLKRYQASKWDEIRSRYFGYVFQNYVLLPELSVYQNLEFVLKMLNLSKEEIDERIEYALKAVGMEKYKKRKPTQLSGGQQQRIAIARALVKSPSVVIADEPTGNLDEKNTTQIMNIIKKISQECLVILVTHERRLAEFYADIIYELADGKIVEERVITAERELFHLDDHNLYLKEFEKEEVEAEDLKIKYFFKEQKPNLNLNIVYKDGIFYINSDQDNLKVQFLDNDSEIKVVDDYKPVIRSESIEKFDYYLPPIGEINKTTKTSFGFGQILKLAFNQLRGMRRRQKLIYFVFFLSAIMICLGFLNLYLATNVDEDNFLYFNRNLIIVEENSIGSSDEIPDFIENVGGSFALPHPNRIKTDSIEIEFFTQVSGSVWIRAGNSVFPLEAVENPKLVIGSLPVNSNQVAIDKSLVDSMLDSPEFKRSGVYYYEQFLGLKMKISFNQTYEIVGIIDNNNPNLYLLEKEFQCLMIGQEYYAVKIKALSTTAVEYYYEIDDYIENRLNATKIPISSLELKDNQALITSYYYGETKKTNVSLGYPYPNDYDAIGIYIGGNMEAMISDAEIDYHYYEFLPRSSFAVYTRDKKATLSKIDALEYFAYDLYEVEYERERDFMYSPEVTAFSLIIIIASLVFLYFLMRSRLISRIYEVGVYRALGVKKGKVYQIFLCEVLILTVLSAVLGIGLITWMITEINKIEMAFHFPWYIPTISFVFMLVVNTLVGLLPVNNLLRLTPSQILSKYDI